MAKRGPRKVVELTIFPMDLRPGDRFSDESGDWIVAALPYTVQKTTTYVRVRAAQDTNNRRVVHWPVHQRVTVKRGGQSGSGGAARRRGS